MNRTDALVLSSQPASRNLSWLRRRRLPPGVLTFFLLGVIAGLLHARLIGLI